MIQQLLKSIITFTLVFSLVNVSRASSTIEQNAELYVRLWAGRADINAPDENGETLLMKVVRGDVPIHLRASTNPYYLALAFGATLSLGHGLSQISSAIRNKSLGPSWNSRDFNQAVSSLEGRLDRMILAMEADLMDERELILNGQVIMIRVLCERGANLNAVNSNGITAWGIAEQEEFNDEILAALQECAAN